MHNPFRARLAPPPQRTGRDLAPVFAVGGVAVLVIVLMFLLRTRADEPAPPPSPEGIRIAAPAPQPDPVPVPQDASIRELAAAFRDGDHDTRTDAPEFAAMRKAVLGLPADAPALDIRPDLLLADPAAHRGAFVRITGRLARILPGKDVHWGAVLARPADIPVHFYLAGAPPPTHTYEKGGQTFSSERVEVEGVFLRAYRYETRTLDGRDGPLATAAVLFARAVRVIPDPPPAPDARGGVVLIVAIMAAVLVVGALVAILLAPRSSRLRRPAAIVDAPGEDIVGDEIHK